MVDLDYSSDGMEINKGAPATAEGQLEIQAPPARPHEGHVSAAGVDKRVAVMDVDDDAVNDFGRSAYRASASRCVPQCVYMETQSPE
jgi:hypothetical protein